MLLIGQRVGATAGRRSDDGMTQAVGFLQALVFEEGAGGQKEKEEQGVAGPELWVVGHVWGSYEL